MLRVQSICARHFVPYVSPFGLLWVLIPSVKLNEHNDGVRSPDWLILILLGIIVEVVWSLFVFADFRLICSELFCGFKTQWYDMSIGLSLLEMVQSPPPQPLRAASFSPWPQNHRPDLMFTCVHNVNQLYLTCGSIIASYINQTCKRTCFD